MMGNSARTESVVRFHDFQVNLETGEVWKAGVRLKLQDQPFKVLAALLQRPGQIVTREELRQLIWPETSFGDFDHAINLAITKLRATLGDSADVPHLIETLPRRGYRFIAAIENLGTEVEDPSPAASRQAAVWKARLALTKRMALAFSLLGSLVLAPIVLRLNLQSPQPRVVDFVQITKDGLANDISTKLLSDGSRVYFEKLVPEGIALMQVSTEGGETARIPVSLELPFAYDISPTRSELLVGGGPFKESSLERPLWVVTLPAGPPHRIGDILAHDACWAPDGLHLAYLNGKDLFVAKPDGSEIRKLATADGFTDAIRFSPDGTRLRFTIFTGAGPDVDFMEIGADGSGLHRLPIQGQSGTWSASGEYYFYSTSRDIWVLPERRSIFGKVKLGTSVQLTAGPLEFSVPLPSADGTRLFVIGIQAKGQLVHYNSKSNQFVPFLGGISAAELEVSRDGQWVAYTTYPECNLWRSKLDGGERLQLTFAPINAHEPRWSPDGKKILFTDVFSKLFVVPAEGGTPQQLMPGDHPNIIGAGAWLPDGNSIVFVRVMGCPVDDLSCLDENSAIHLLDLKTQQVSRLPGSDGLVASRVSRDGRYLAALSDKKNKLMLYDFQTERWAELGEGGGSIEWSHDSRSVYHTLLRRDQAGQVVGFSEVARISVPDGKIQRVLDLRDMPVGGKWYPWVNLMPDDSLLLMLEQSTREIYRLDLQYR